MKAAISSLIGLMLSISVSAEPLIEGRVRLDSGEPVADAQVRFFDLTDLERGAVGRAMTDDTGYFALPLAALPGMTLPERFELGANYPNPFNPSTIIPYQLAASSQVRLEVFNLLGQHIATLVDGERTAGFHTATWHATDGAGRAVGTGMYIYRMTVGVESQTGRMVLIDGQAGLSAGGATSVMPGASGVGGADGKGAQVYGLVVSGSGLVSYVDSSFRVEAGMAPVELVMSSGQQHSAGKVTDDDCPLCGFLDAFNDAEEEADLIVYASVSDNIPTPGQAFTLKARVQNQGTDEFQDLVLSYYRSSDATISTQDMLLGTDEVGSLAASGTSGNESISLTASSTSGTYYYGACVASVRDEGDTLNYCSTGVRVIVADEEDQVTIPDANLRAAIEDALGKAKGATITVAEMKTLHHLDAAKQGISDLTGLEFATNMTWLHLVVNDISDVSALGGLPKLTDLSLWSNNISDVSALGGLPKLTYLSLGVNNISDVSALGGLPKLTELGLAGNNISDVSALGGLPKLTELGLAGNDISDVSALGGLPKLIWLDLEGNNISDVSALGGLPKLTELDLRGNFLSGSSIKDHIPALERSGVTVHFYPFREGDFDIELVFLDHFTESRKRNIRYAARVWMSIIKEDLPDYKFTQGWSATCNGQSYRIPVGERIDDLRIYVTKAEVAGTASYPGVFRMTPKLPVLGCIEVRGDDLDVNLHEMGHTLGIGIGMIWDDLIQDPNGDIHFNGPLAIAAFNDAGGWDYTGAKVPVTKGGGHWRFGGRSHFIESILFELMEPWTFDRTILSSITIQALADLGYSVDVTYAEPYTLPTRPGGAAKPSAKIVAQPTKLRHRHRQQREPIYVVDPQGNIVRTLHR